MLFFSFSLAKVLVFDILCFISVDLNRDIVKTGGVFVVFLEIGRGKRKHYRTQSGLHRKYASVATIRPVAMKISAGRFLHSSAIR